MQGHFAALYSKCVIFCMLSLTNVPNISLNSQRKLLSYDIYDIFGYQCLFYLEGRELEKLLFD